MTMLDAMRRRKAILKWSLAIVVVAFALLYIPNFVRNPLGTNADDAIATVNGRVVKAGDFRTLYDQQVEAMRGQYGGTLTPEMLKQFGIEQRLIQQMIEEEAVLAEADRLGLTVTDGELRERLVRMPGFQENGVWVGDERYRQILGMQRPPLRAADFEDQIRRSLVTEKLQAAVTGWVRVSDSDVDQEYRKRNEKVKLDLAIFTANNFRTGLQATDAELTAEYNANPDAFKTPEKRHARFLNIDAQALRDKVTVTPQEIAARFDQNKQTYQTPEQIRASHILFKTEGKDDAAVKKLAESVLAKAKAPGADFAALAKQYSDDSTKDKGGDLDYFGHGTMVKEFDDAAWKLQIGQISDLVKTEFGYHIIKLVDKKPAVSKTLAEVTPQIDDQIRWEKAQAEAQKISDAVAGDIKTPADLDRVARARGLTVGDSGYFAREEPIAGLGFAQSVTAQAFTMQPNTVSGAIKTEQGFAYIALVDIKAPYVPKLDEVKDKVRENVIRKKALDLAKAKAATLSQTAGKGDFAAAAKALGVEVKTTDSIARGAALPDIGVTPVVDDAVFPLAVGAVSQPITTDTAIVVAHVVEKKDVTPTGLAAERDSLRQELIQQKRQEFFAAYMTKAKQKMKIEYNNDVIQSLLGPA